MPLGREVGLGPGHIVLDGDPAPPSRKGHSPHSFRPMYIVAKQLPISATAEFLFRIYYWLAYCPDQADDILMLQW